MIAIIGKMVRDGEKVDVNLTVPANHSEALGPTAWGFAIAGGLLLATVAFLCLILFAA